MSQLKEVGFEWLENLHKKRQQCYTTCDWAKPAKSLDFGADGFTASLTDYHELLQLTAPDSICGIVYVRGNFPDNPESILARSQRRDDLGDKGTFGLQIESQAPSLFGRAERIAHGLVNFRWPYSQYELRRKTKREEFELGDAGTCEAISWVKDGTAFQALRLKPTTQYDSPCVKVRFGGKIRFGCPCTNKPPMEKNELELEDKLSWNLTDDALQLSLSSFQYGKRLEMQLFIDGEAQELKGPPDPPDSATYWSHCQEIRFERGRPQTIVATYSLVDDNPRLADQVENVARYKKSVLREVESHLGISDNSVEMTDRLWTACVPPNYTAIQAREFCALARCVEQIMGVTSIPISAQFGTALVYNIITSQYVNLQSTFWQIRYLVKAYQYIHTRHFGEEILKSNTTLDEIRDDYLEKIRTRILQALVWVLKANNETGKLLLPIAKGHSDFQNEQTRSCCRAMRQSIKRDTSYNQAYFQSLAVWYVMKHCETAITPHFVSTVLMPEIEKLAKDENEERKYSEDRVSTPKRDILQWFRYRCLDLICKTAVKEGGNARWYEESRLKSKITIAKAESEKFVLRVRESRQGPDSTTDEEVDRLYLLGEELFGFSHESQQAQQIDLAEARAAEAKIRIETRKPTSQFNPGPKHGDALSEQPCHAPWELSCLNNQSILRMAAWSKDLGDIGDRRDRVFQFILSDHTFMTTWDRADSSMIGKWWDMEPDSVICATLIDLKLQGLESLSHAESLRESRAHGFAGILGTVGGNESISRKSTGLLPGTQGSEDQQNSVDIKLDDIGPREQQLHRGATRREKGFGFENHKAGNRSFYWLAYKPSQWYHSKWQVQSLEVFKPEIRDLASKKKITKYLWDREALTPAPGPLALTPKLIRKPIVFEDVRLLNAFHLFLSEDSRFLKQPEPVRISQPAGHFEDLFKSLDTSLVDLGAKHRVLFAERCSPSMVKGFVHLWHPDALDPIDTYFGNISRFQESREPMWTTSITISHWNIGNIDGDSFSKLSSEDTARFKEGNNRKNAGFPPLSVLAGRDKKTLKKKGDSRPFIEERCLSLMLTGDSFGYSWTCSLWSSISNVQLVESCITLALPKLQHFIHQPASGRCIFFIILLGHICETLANKYKLILSRLDEIVELGDQVLLEGFDWETENAVEKLKKHLWGLEAYRIIGDRLESSLLQIQRAHQSVEHTAKLEAPRQHDDLVEEYNNVMEDFEKQYNMLTGVQLRFKSKIIQLSGLRDGISTVTNVEDTRTTIKQGNNIRMLTMITIGYLPISYVTSLVSVPDWALPRKEGLSIYLRYLFSFFFVTFVIAFSLDLLIKQVDWIVMKMKLVKKRLSKPASEEPPLINPQATTRRRRTATESSFGEA